MYTYCIWDFNGTILNDVELGVYSVNLLMKNHGVPLVLSRDAYRERFDFPIIDYYRELGFDFDKTPYELLAKEWVDIYMENLFRAELFPELKGALEFFKSKGIAQSVLSASENDMLNGQIKGLGISSYFENIMGIDNIYGDSKLAIARRWREAHPDDKVIFIGDTTHDIETAKELGAECFIVCAGHQCKKRFESCEARVFESLGELIESLK